MSDLSLSSHTCQLLFSLLRGVLQPWPHLLSSLGARSGNGWKFAGFAHGFLPQGSGRGNCVHSLRAAFFPRVCTLSSVSDEPCPQPALMDLQKDVSHYFGGTSMESEEFISSPALPQCAVELCPPFPHHFSFHSSLHRAIPTHKGLHMMIWAGTICPLTIISVLIIARKVISQVPLAPELHELSSYTTQILGD